MGRCEDFPGDVALETADDFVLGLALGQPTGQVVLGGLVVAQPYQHDPVERGVGLAVTTGVEAVPDGLARDNLLDR